MDGQAASANSLAARIVISGRGTIERSYRGYHQKVHMYRTRMIPDSASSERWLSKF